MNQPRFNSFQTVGFFANIFEQVDLDMAALQ
jgi:hypothetical protein